MPLAAIMPLCTAYNIQHTTSHHAYDIYTSTTSSMQVCNNNLKCRHFSPNCADVLNVGSVPTPDPKHPWGPLYRNKTQSETKYMVKKQK